MSLVPREKIEQAVAQIKSEIIAWRRDFHRFPEVAFQEERTSQVIQQLLQAWGLEVRRLAGTGLRAVLPGGRPGPVVALRADMDALPLQEEGDKPVLSAHQGVAHCCGHDGHMAILLGVAKVMLQLKEALPGEVVFIFQPAEERPPGGAKLMIEEGVLEGVTAIFGLHLWQPLPTGKIALRAGPMMAQADEFEIEVLGKGGHGSMPHQTVDPIWVAAQIVSGVQGLVSRETDPLQPLVISFGTIHGGTIHNIIPEKVRLTGTVRTLDEKLQARIEKRLPEVCQGVGQTWGAEAQFAYKRGYPALVNPPEMVEFVQQVVRQLWGEERLVSIKPVMGGEDFAYYLKKIPGAFFFFGAGNQKQYPHHHPRFDIDEEALPEATFLLTNLAWEYLSQGGRE